MANAWFPHLKAKFGTLDAAALTQLEQMVGDFEAAMLANKPKNRSEDPYRIKVRRASISGWMGVSLISSSARTSIPRRRDFC